MNTDKMSFNVVSGFKYTGIYSFYPGNVNYSKVIVCIKKTKYKYKTLSTNIGVHRYFYTGGGHRTKRFKE